MATEARSWTVTTWNVHGSAKPDTDALAAAIEVESPDVVLLQEVRQGQARKIAERLGMRYTWALKHYPFTPLLGDAAEGAAIMTPHALDAAGHSEISDGRTTWTYHRRIAQWCLVGRPDTSAYRVYNLHLSPGQTDGAARRAEAVAAAEIITAHGDAPPSIVGGDFNDDTDVSIIYALPGLEHITPPMTSPAHAPKNLLDHVLLPPDAANVTTTVPAGGPEWAALSDHLPLTVRFDLDWVEGDII
jgi:endonuclease/exonuclease/phosphatase family metal-dependent hydrolase